MVMASELLKRLSELPLCRSGYLTEVIHLPDHQPALRRQAVHPLAPVARLQISSLCISGQLHGTWARGERLQWMSWLRGCRTAAWMC